MSSQERAIRRVIVGGLLTAVTLLLSLTPIGFIPVPTPAGSATIAHIPAIIGGVLEGPLVGLIVSFGFGFGSFLSPLVPVKDPLVIIVPRLLIGPVAAWVFAAVRRKGRSTFAALLVVTTLLALYAAYQVYLRTAWLGIAVALVIGAAAAVAGLWIRLQHAAVVGLGVCGIAGSLTNTVLVLSAAVMRQIPGITPEVAVTIGLTQGIPEAVVSAIIVVIVVTALGRVYGGRARARISSAAE